MDFLAWLVFAASFVGLVLFVKGRGRGC